MFQLIVMVIPLLNALLISGILFLTDDDDDDEIAYFTVRWKIRKLV